METHWTEQTARLRKLYADMGDGELEALADEAYTLTDIARQTLLAELSSRGMHVALRDAPAPRNSFNMPDLNLVVYRRVADLAEARWLKNILENAGVASCLGPDNLYNLDEFRSSFTGGVDLKILERDLQTAAAATRGLYPPDPADELDDIACDARCPKCHSSEIVFEGREAEPGADPDLDSKFNWSCDVCGHHWQDDGIAQG